MKLADERMGNEFWEWFNDCPVIYHRLKVNSETIHYSFESPDDESQQELFKNE